MIFEGIYPNELNISVIFNIAISFGSEAQSKGEKKIIIGRDGRLSSLELSNALSEGLQVSGCEVIDIGEVPTPILYFATITQGTGTGVMITGSHNPKHYNGLKMMIAGKTLSQYDIQALKERILKENVVLGVGDYHFVDMLKNYINYICKKETLFRSFKIVIDAGNGIAGRAATMLFEALGCKVIQLFCEVDGNFPNHHPDPSNPKNLKDLIHSVEHNNADIGFAFDGDGDRIGVITPKKKNILPDRQLMLYAKYVIANNPGAIVIFDIKCSKNLKNFITVLGGKPIMYKTGHAFIKQKLKECNADLAGEMSGHFFFNDRWFGFDDGLYAGVRLLNILSLENKSIDQVFESIPININTLEINLPISENKKFHFMKNLLKNSQKQFPKEKIITIDGIRIEFIDGWGLVRASNTTSYLTMKFEANNKDALTRIKKKFTDWVKREINLN